MVMNAKTHLKTIKNNLKKQQRYRIAVNSHALANRSFDKNDYVKNIYGIYGIVSKKENNQIIVSWNDNTYERIQLENINNYLSKIDEEEYQLHNNKIPDIEKVQLQQKVAELENKITNKQVKQVKYDAATELVDLAINKGIVDENDRDIEVMKVEAFDDSAFEQYKEMVLNFSTEGGEVSSLALQQQQNVDTDGLSKEEIEAKNMLAQLKFQRGISSSNINTNMEFSDSRSLNDISTNMNRITFANTNNGKQVLNKPVTFDDTLASMELAKSATVQNIDTKVEEESANNFLKSPISGLTKPLLIDASNNINSMNTAFKELFSPDMWTSIGRK